MMLIHNGNPEYIITGIYYTKDVKVYSLGL